MDHQGYFVDNEIKYNIRKKASIGAGLTISSNIINYGISTVCTIILSRLLSPDDFGLVTMVMTVSLLLRNFGVNGFTEAIIQEKQLNHSKVNSLFWVHLLINTSLALLFILVAPVIMWFYQETRLKPIIYAMSITIIAPCFSTHHSALLQRNLMFSKYAIIDITTTLVSSTLGVLSALFGIGYWAIVIRRSAIPIAKAAISWIVCKWRPSFPKYDKDIMNLIRFGVQTYGNFATNYFSKNIDNILLGKYFGAVQLANYDRAYHLFLMPLNRLNTPLTRVALPLLTKLKSDPVKYIRYYTKSISILSLIGMLVSSIVIVSGREIITFILGPQWHLAGNVFSIFGTAIGFMLIYRTISWLHLSLGNADRYFKWGIFSVAITVIFIVAGLQYGAVGIAFGYSMSFYFLLIPGMWYALRPLNISVSVIIKVIYKQVFSAIIAVSICIYFKSHYALVANFLDSLNISFKVIILTCICATIYISTNFAFHLGLGPTRDAINFARDMMPNRISNK